MNQQITANESTVQMEMFGLVIQADTTVPNIHKSDPPTQTSKPMPRIEIMVPKAIHALVIDDEIKGDTRTYSEPQKSPTVDFDLDDLDTEDDDEKPVNLDVIEKTDTYETFIAKRMIRRMLDDLNEQFVSDLKPDMYGISFPQDKTDKQQKEVLKLDALIWLYGLNPDGSIVTFEWACDEVGLNPEIIRNVTARSMRAELKIVLKFLAQMVGHQFAIACECELAEYVNLSGWNLN